MQNRYAGDVGDFGKFGLLRYIERKQLSVGVNWYLVADEVHNSDGKHIGYLSNKSFNGCDDDLMNKLALICKSSNRTIMQLEKSVRKHSMKSIKYVFPEEIIDYYKAGHSVIFYNHRTRETKDIYLTRFNDLFCSLKLNDASIRALTFKRGTIRDFFIISQPKYKEIIDSLIDDFMKTRWNQHFDVLI